MSLMERLKSMLGFHGKAKPNYIGPEVSRAIQRNEQASAETRKLLQEMKDSGGMTTTLRQIAGKMK